MNGSEREPLERADFEPCFEGEPTVPPVAADLARGRTRLRRRRAAIGGAVGGVTALVAVSLVLTGGALGADGGVIAPVATPSAVPTVTSSPTPASDTAPTLRFSQGQGYLDRDGRSLGQGLGEDTPPFAATTENSWTVARRHLDPQHRHLEAYDRQASSGGSSGSDVQIGQKIGWTVAGDPGQGMVQLAVSRLEPGASPRVGQADGSGMCPQFSDPGKVCAKQRIDGLTVWTVTLPDGGFIMDHLQRDGEVASIVVDPVFGNNTTVALKEIPVSPAAAAALLDDPDLDVIG